MTKMQMKQKLNETINKIGKISLEIQLLLIKNDKRIIKIPFLIDNLKEELLHGVMLNELINANQNDKPYHNVSKNR